MNLKTVAVAGLAAALFATGMGCSKKEGNPQSQSMQVQTLHPPLDDMSWGAKYQKLMAEAVKNHAAKTLHVDPNYVSLSEGLPHTYETAGRSREYRNSKWVQAKAGNRIVLYNMDGMERKFSNQFGRRYHDMNDINRFFGTELQNWNLTALIEPAEHDSAVFVREFGFGREQEQTKLSNGKVVYSQSLDDGMPNVAFRDLPGNLRASRGRVPVLKLNGRKFVPDKPYRGIYGGDGQHLLHDRGAGVYFVPRQILLKCRSVQDPDSCVPSGYKGEFFNQPRGDPMGDFSVDALLVSGKPKDEVQPLKGPGKDYENFNRLVPRYLR